MLPSRLRPLPAGVMVAPHELGGTRIHLAHIAGLLFALTAIASPAAWAASAHAALPGENGKIVFMAASNIHTINPDGSGLTDLTAGQGENFNPAWSPDGRELAFTSNRDGNDEIYVMNADGSNQRRITSDPATDAEPSWSPDGQRIVFESNRDGNYELYVMDADGSNQARLTNTPQNEASPAWSPDGRKIAFDEGGSAGIFVMNADGSGRTRLGTIGTFMPNWSPDGREIWSWWEYYDPINEVTYSDLASYDLQTGVENESHCVDCFASMPAVSPDNTEVVFTLSAELTVIPTHGGGGRRLAVAGDDADWQPILRGYVRPKGATPIRVPLVPAFKACTSANSTHGAPLSYGSCAPPMPESASAFIGVGDGDPAPARSIGSVNLRTLTGSSPDGADVGVNVSITNVMKTSDRSDYTGELRLELPLRITDRFNKPHPAGNGPGTVSDTSFFATVPCSVTADTSLGSSCALSTTADTLLPGTVRGGARAIWGLGEIRLHDGGPDGDADTTADNELFAVQGVFAP
jgi:hypothetical protein